MASITELAAELGLNTVAVLSAARLEEQIAGDIDRLRVWQEEGFAGEMRFMERAPELFHFLSNFLPGVKSVIVFGVSYLHGSVRSVELPRFHGRIARYAYGLDYHAVLKERIGVFAERLKQELNVSFGYRVFSDAVPLLERAIARAGGLGFIGKNTLLITPGAGSYFFIGELLLDLKLDEMINSSRGVGCGSCQRCLVSCPTAAFKGPHTLDARRCISYLTIEKRSEFSQWEREAIGEWVFGCDICQEVCPFNNEGVTRSVTPEFTGKFGPTLDLRKVLALRDNAQYRAFFRGSAILRAKREQLIRNAASVCANLRYYELAPWLMEVFDREQSEVVRSSVGSALLRLEDGLDSKVCRKIREKIGVYVR